MTAAEMLSALIARRDRLIAEQDALRTAGNHFSADDLQPSVVFSIRAAHEALMGKATDHDKGGV